MGCPQLDTLCYIHEQTSYEEDYNNFGYKIVQSASGVKDRFYLIFDAILQSFGVLNRNKRQYILDNIWNLIQTDEYIQTMLKHNSWCGEIDHPAAAIIGQELTLNRIANPNIGLTSHYIRSPRINGNLLEATIQTDDSTDAGMNMAYKIVDGKIIPCFSARVLGALSNKTGISIVHVRKLICYDWVFFPSHSEARGKINQPLQESTNEFEKYTGCKIIKFPELAKMAAASSKETEWLCESFGLDMDDVTGVTESGNSIVLTGTDSAFVQPITDKAIRNRTKSLLNDWMNK